MSLTYRSILGSWYVWYVWWWWAWSHLYLKTWRKPYNNRLVVSTHLKNISQNGNLPQFSGWKIKTYLKPPPRSCWSKPGSSLTPCLRQGSWMGFSWLPSGNAPPTSTNRKKKVKFQLGVVGFKSKWWQLKYVRFSKIFLEKNWNHHALYDLFSPWFKKVSQRN